MARLHTSGGEIRDHNTVAAEASPDGRSAGTAACTTETTIFRSGLASIKCPGSSSLTAFHEFAIAPTAGTGIWVRTYLYFDALPSATKKVSRIGTAQVSVRLTSAGKLQLWNDAASTQIGSDSTMTLATGTWYRVSLYGVVGVGATDAVELRVTQDEGFVETVASTSAVSITDTNPTTVSMGWIEAPGVASNMYLDDIAVNDSTGTKQNSWALDGHVVLLLTRASPLGVTPGAWIRCSGTVSESCIDNLPSLGHIDGTETSGVEHQFKTTDNTGDSPFDVQLSGYSRAGVQGDYIVGPPYTSHFTQAVILQDGGNLRVAAPLRFSGTVGGVRAYISLDSGTPPGVLRLRAEIQGDDGTNPDSNVLGSGEIAFADIPTTIGWVDIPFSQPAPLLAGSRYWIVLSRADGNAGSPFLRWGLMDGLPAAAYDFAPDALTATNRIYSSVTGLWSTPIRNPHEVAAYASGGVQPVRVWQGLVCHAEAISTGTKTGTIEGIQNPVVAAASFDYGGNAGAAGVYPTAWRWAKVTTYEAGINVALSCKLRVNKTDTTTRGALISFVGSYVEYAYPDPGWVEYVKTSDSSHWWTKQMTTNTVWEKTVSGAEAPITIMSGDYAIAPDPLPNIDEGDTANVASIDEATLLASYTLV
jgi:hypothetical protein